MALTELKIKSAKPTDKIQKLSDGGGLTLVLPTNGSGKYWRFNYRFEGKQKTLALGTYPLIGLAEARRKRDNAKKLLLDNVDPSLQKRLEAQKQEIELNIRFENVAREWWCTTWRLYENALQENQHSQEPDFSVLNKEGQYG